MGRYGRDTEEVVRDLVIAFQHPDYSEQPPIETLRELKEARR
mgnify:CR=1 FL=1